MSLPPVASTLVSEAPPEPASFCSFVSSLHLSWWVLSESCQATVPTDPRSLASRARPPGAYRGFNASMKETRRAVWPCGCIPWREEGTFSSLCGLVSGGAQTLQCQLLLPLCPGNCTQRTKCTTVHSSPKQCHSLHLCPSRSPQPLCVGCRPIQYVYALKPLVLLHLPVL